MDSTPLPKQDNGDSDSDCTGSVIDEELTHYVVRITPCDKFTFSDLETYFKSEPQLTRYVIGRETVPREHFHAVLSVDENVTEVDVRDIVKAFLVPFWQTDVGKLPRGFGNKQYNLQLSEDVDKAVSYAVKMNEFVYEGWTDVYIQFRREESFEKKKPSDFKSEYRQLCEDFKTSTMDIREFMINFSLLKAKYGQQVRMHDAYSYALSNLFIRDPSEAENYVENFLYKQ